MPIKTKVLFANRQFTVTEHGIVANPEHRYGIITPKQMTETRGQDFYSWPLQMAEKNWVDVGEFVAAFRFSMNHFHPDHDIACLWEGIARAYRQRVEDLELDIAALPKPPETLGLSGSGGLGAVYGRAEAWRDERYGYAKPETVGSEIELE